MRKSKFSEEQIINLLKSVEAGQKVADVCRSNGISEQTYQRWKANESVWPSRWTRRFPVSAWRECWRGL